MIRGARKKNVFGKQDKINMPFSAFWGFRTAFWTPPQSIAVPGGYSGSFLARPRGEAPHRVIFGRCCLYDCWAGQDQRSRYLSACCNPFTSKQSYPPRCCPIISSTFSKSRCVRTQLLLFFRSGYVLSPRVSAQHSLLWTWQSPDMMVSPPSEQFTDGRSGCCLARGYEVRYLLYGVNSRIPDLRFPAKPHGFW